MLLMWFVLKSIYRYIRILGENSYTTIIHSYTEFIDKKNFNAIISPLIKQSVDMWI